MDLSVIIPAFNEEHRLPRTVEQVHSWLTARSSHAEIILVDDGSTDGTVQFIVTSHHQYPELRISSNERNRGKGYCVRRGMLEAQGRIALFTDADLSAPIEEADKLLGALTEKDADVAIGSRGIDRSVIEVHQSYLRECAGIVFNRLVRWITGVGFADTQCGLKAFRLPRARMLFEQQRTDGFGFDVEILFLAQRHGLSVVEIPVRWAHNTGSKVDVLSDGLQMLMDLLAIRWNLVAGHYPKPRES